MYKVPAASRCLIKILLFRMPTVYWLSSLAWPLNLVLIPSYSFLFVLGLLVPLPGDTWAV